MSVVHLMRYRQKTFAITALVLSFLILASVLIATPVILAHQAPFFESRRYLHSDEHTVDMYADLRRILEENELEELERRKLMWESTVEQYRRGQGAGLQDLERHFTGYMNYANLTIGAIDYLRNSYLITNQEVLSSAFDISEEERFWEQQSRVIQEDIRYVQETMDNLTHE
jgi:hypothetical protein